MKQHHKEKIRELAREMRLKADEHNDQFLHSCANRLNDIADSAEDDDSGSNPNNPPPPPPPPGGH